MFVAIVTAPSWPASSMISASRSCCFAFRTLCGMPAARQQLREVLGGLDRDRADEDGLALLVALLDVLDDRVELRFLRLEDEVVLVVARDRHVGRDLDDVQAVDLDELLLLRLRRAGHAGELLVEAEVVLERDRRERDVLLLDRTPSFASTAWCRPSDQRRPSMIRPVNSSTILTSPSWIDVVDVALVERLRLERLGQVVDELDVARVVEVVDLERALDLLDRALARRDGLVLLVEEVVDVEAGELVLALASCGSLC